MSSSELNSQHTPMKERRSSGLGKFLKNLKNKETNTSFGSFTGGSFGSGSGISSGGSNNGGSANFKSNTLHVPLSSSASSSPFSSHTQLPTASSSPSLTLPQSNNSNGHGQVSRRLSSTSLRSSNSSLSVKFMDTVTVEDDDGASTTSLKSEKPLRPRSSTKSEKKERFSFITRSLRRNTKVAHETEPSADLPPTHPFSNGEHQNQQSAYSWDQRVEIKSSMGSNTSTENLESAAATASQLMSTPDKKSRRNSIFVRLLNRGKKDSPSEEDFVIESGVVGCLDDSTNTSPTHSPMLSKRTKSMQSVHSGTGLPPPIVDELREQLFEANSEISNLRLKESEWRREREDLIRKIKALSEKQSSGDSFQNLANAATSPPRSPHSHSNSEPQLSALLSGQIKRSVSQDDDSSFTGSMSKSPSINSFSHAEILQQHHQQQTNQQPTLSQSSSSISFITAASMATPNPSPPPQPKRNRYTLAIPKWDDSMNFNGTPFERLVQVLQSSCEIFPPPSESSHLLAATPNGQVPKPALSLMEKFPSASASNNATKSKLGNSSDSTMSASELANLEEKRQRKLILSSCLEKLLYKLIDENNDISAISKTFFTTYECIYDSHEIIDKLISIFKNESPQSQMRICTIIRNWLQNYYIPALCDCLFVGKIKDFILEIRVTDKESYNYSRLVDLCNQITYILETKIIERGGIIAYHSPFNVVDKQYVLKKSNAKIKTVLATSLKSSGKDHEPMTPTILWNQQQMLEDLQSSPPPSPPPVLSKHERVHQLMGSPSHLTSTDHATQLQPAHYEYETRPRSSTWSTPDIFLSIMDAPSKEIAKSLTVIDYAIFICIDPPELMNGVWGKPHMKDRALNITKLISRFNEISMNVIQTILNEEKLKDRCKVMAKLIKIAKHLHDLRNYNSMMAIYAGISHSAVVRLKWTKKILPKVNQKALQDLEKLMDSEENFKNYRNELRTITTPCIPFLGLILSDMTFIQEGNPDFIGNDVNSSAVNIAKLKMVYNCIKQIQQFQKNSYLLNADPRLTHLLTPNFNIFGEASNTYLLKSGGSSSSSTNNSSNINNNSTSTNKTDSENVIDSNANDDIENDNDNDEEVNNHISDTSDNEIEIQVTPAPETGDNKKENREEILERRLSQDRLYRSFTLDDKEKKNNYSTWSPSKNFVMNSNSPNAQKKKRKPLIPASFERSQSETCLPLGLVKPAQPEEEPAHLLNAFIDSAATSPITSTISNSLLSGSDHLIPIPKEVAEPSPSIVIHSESPSSSSSGSPPTQQLTSRMPRRPSVSSPPSPPSPRRLISLSHSKSQSNLKAIPESSSPLRLEEPIVARGSPAATASPVGASAANLDSQITVDTTPNAPRKSSRAKSISTNNIFSVLSTNPGGQSTKESYLSPKSHNRSSSTSTWNGASTNNSTSPSPLNSGNVSPGNISSHGGHYQSLVNHNSSSFSIFTNKRKSIANMESMMSAQRLPHSFAPMTDEGLFHLSLKLEPRGVKYQDLQ